MPYEKLSTSLRKFVRSLATTKGRREGRAFVVERTKNVLDFLESDFELLFLIAKNHWLEENADLKIEHSKIRVASSDDMERLTTMKTPSEVIAVFKIPEENKNGTEDSFNLKDLLKAPFDGLKDKSASHSDILILALDGIQDPGNMGTIVRLADWFGIKTIFASPDTVDVYNPKCIISSMGSLSRVNVIHTDLEQLLSYAKKINLPVWGTFMSGQSVYNIDKTEAKGIIVMGNEGHGISQKLLPYITHSVTIPRYPTTSIFPESLNVAMATSIIVAEFRRTQTSN